MKGQPPPLIHKMWMKRRVFLTPPIALYGSKKDCTRADTVILPISEVCDGTVSLPVCFRHIAKKCRHDKNQYICNAKNTTIYYTARNKKICWKRIQIQ